MKKLVSLVLALTFIFTLSACSGKDMGRVKYNLDMEDFVELSEFEGIKIDTNSADYQKIYNDFLVADVQNYGLYGRVTEGTLKKGDVEIKNVEVHNFDKSDCLIKNCYVVRMAASVDDEYKVVLPGNIKPGMSEADYLAAIKDIKYEFDSTHFNEYIFKKGDLSITIDVDKDDKTVKYILVAYDVTEE